MSVLDSTLTLFLDKNFSLLCSTLRCYFEGRKELFEGLKIMYLEHEWDQASCYLPKYMVDPKICFCCEQKESDLPVVGILQGE